MLDLMRKIMGGQIPPVMIAAIIVGLRVKKETIGEITAAAQVMRELATRVTVKDPDNLVDIVGTGGDGANINLKPEQVGRCIDEIGVGFILAPAHHAAMKHAAAVRREPGVRNLYIM